MRASRPSAAWSLEQPIVPFPSSYWQRNKTCRGRCPWTISVSSLREPSRNATLLYLGQPWFNQTRLLCYLLSLSGSLQPLKPILRRPSVTSKNPDPLGLDKKLSAWLARTEIDVPPEEFIAQFFSAKLSTWDHYIHIRIAYVILTTYGRQKGKNMIFDGIEKFIARSPIASGRTFFGYSSCISVYATCLLPAHQTRRKSRLSIHLSHHQMILFASF
ncbi:hypothetical protein DFS33DRAFT_116381 [Desarmillaria ectypa]|nr:hypothetical protein DFS33DRAFT_116381 [Desarmillaria ectypa]